MRFLIAFLLLTCPLFAAEELEIPKSAKPKPGINMYATHAEARNAAAEDPNKRLFCMFTTTWCQPCQQLKADVIFNKQIWEGINKYAIVYFVDVDKEVKVAQIYKQSGVWGGNLPTCFVYSKDTKFILGTLEGYTSIQRFAQWWNDASKRDKTKPGVEPIIPQAPPKVSNMLLLALWLNSTFPPEEIAQLVSMLQPQNNPKETSILVEPMSIIDDDLNK